MKRAEMLAFLQANHFRPVTHRLFSEEEYIYSAPDGRVYDENDYLFEDWDPASRAHIGLRMRKGGSWDDGWETK